MFTAALVGVASASAACDSPTANPSVSQGTPSTTALDPCVVGTWKTVSKTGSLTDPNGNVIAMTGGAGGVLTVNADGTVRIDDSAEKPDTGRGADGTAYTLTTTGMAGGRVQTGAGQITVTLDATAALTQTISRNGSPVASQTPSQTASNQYQCSRGKSLVTTSSSGVVTTYTPAG